MKNVIENYAFSASAKTITLTDFSAGNPIALNRLYLITDTTLNAIAYNFADSTVATATISSGNVITLSAVPAGAANTDSLQIIYEVTITDPVYERPVTAVSDRSGNFVDALPTNGAPTTLSSTAVVALYTPATGKSTRLKWLYLKALRSNAAAVVVSIVLDGTQIYNIPLDPGDVFAHKVVREGTANGTLTAQCSVSGSVYVNVDAVDFLS